MLKKKYMKEIVSSIKKYEKDVMNFFLKFLEIDAVNPKYGGKGEYERANFLEEYLKSLGLNVLRYDYRDEFGYKRPNIITGIEKNKDKTIWFLLHLDTVDAGSVEMWKYDPFKPTIVEDKIYARGSEDNGQAIASTILMLKTIIEEDFDINYNLRIAFVSDEEAGSKYGIKRLMEENIFKRNDYFIVPDASIDRGKYIEIAEKSIVWLKIRVIGKQGHASTPELAKNAARISMKFYLEMDEFLHKKYSKRNPFFKPPESTFEITKRERNVESINIIPGEDITYFDFRILPEYNVDEILNDILSIKDKYEKEYGVKIFVECISRDECKNITSTDSFIYKLLEKSIEINRKFKPKPIGIGGGTYARYLRNNGYDAVVWQTSDNTAHQVNEYCRISDIIDDAKVFLTCLII